MATILVLLEKNIRHSLFALKKTFRNEFITIKNYEPKNKKVNFAHNPKSFLKKASKLKTYNAVQGLAKCNCGE
jgi:hypothetical protein